MHLIVDICVALEKNTMFSAQSLNEKKYLWIYQQMNLVGIETTEVLKDSYVPDVCLTKSTWENGFNLVPPLFREHCVQLL